MPPPLTRNAVLARLGQLNPSCNLEHLELCFAAAWSPRERFQSMRDQWDQPAETEVGTWRFSPTRLLTDISTAEKRLAESDATDNVLFVKTPSNAVNCSTRQISRACSWPKNKLQIV